MFEKGFKVGIWTVEPPGCCWLSESGPLGCPELPSHKDPPCQTFPSEEKYMAMFGVEIKCFDFYLTFFSSFFAFHTLMVILPGATTSSSATISTDLTDGARLCSLEAGLEEALDAGLEETTDGGLEESLERAARHCTDTWTSPDLAPSSTNHFSAKPLEINWNPILPFFSRPPGFEGCQSYWLRHCLEGRLCQRHRPRPGDEKLSSSWQFFQPIFLVTSITNCCLESPLKLMFAVKSQSGFWLFPTWEEVKRQMCWWNCHRFWLDPLVSSHELLVIGDYRNCHRFWLDLLVSKLD